MHRGARLDSCAEDSVVVGGCNVLDRGALHVVVDRSTRRLARRSARGRARGRARGTAWRIA